MAVAAAFAVIVFPVVAGVDVVGPRGPLGTSCAYRVRPGLAVRWPRRPRVRMAGSSPAMRLIFEHTECVRSGVRFDVLDF